MLYLEPRKDFSPLFNAVGCLCLCGGRFLLLKRGEVASYPGRWGIPSGKIAPSETSLHAMVRELFEETGILASSDKLEFFSRYYITNEQASFIYDVYQLHLTIKPDVQLSAKEHQLFEWVTPESAFRLPLIPDLYPIIWQALPQSQQLCLFGPTNGGTHASLEARIRDGIPETPALHTAKIWYTSFGPPGAGKSSALKAMARLSDSTLNYVSETGILHRHSRFYFYLERAFVYHEKYYLSNFQQDIVSYRFWQTYNSPQFSLVDESIHSSLAYARALLSLGWLTPHDYTSFYATYVLANAFLSAPVAIYYFRCDPDMLVERIARRGRKIERHYPREYITALVHAFAYLSAELAEKYNVITIDTTHQTADYIAHSYMPVT